MIEKDYVVIKTQSLRQDKIAGKGVEGKDLIISTDWNPEHHVQNWGEIMFIPRYLSNTPIDGIPTGPPDHGDNHRPTFIRMKDIVMDAKIGDRAYFHRNNLLQLNVKKNLIDKKKINDDLWEYTIRIKYHSLYCVVREGKIIPIASRVLIRPDMESYDDILIPVPVVVGGKIMVDKHSNPVMKPKSQWIQKKAEPTHKARLGFVEHIGSPLKTETCEINVGDHIIYRKMADHPVRIESKIYFPIKMKNIEAVIEN